MIQLKFVGLGDAVSRTEMCGSLRIGLELNLYWT